jgi:hypothetical protein
MKKKQKDKPSKNAAYFVELASLSDLARGISNFSGSVKPIFALKKDGTIKLFTNAGKLQDTSVILFVDTKKTSVGSTLVYRPKMAASEEVLEMRDRIMNPL